MEELVTSHREMMLQLAQTNQQSMRMRRDMEALAADRDIANVKSVVQAEKLTKAEVDLAKAETSKFSDFCPSGM